MENELQSGPAKEAHEILFCRKIKTTHPQIFFNNIPVSKVDYPK